MASITKRGDSYRFTVSCGFDEKGKHLQKTMTYHPQARSPKAIEKEVAEAARDFENRVLNGGYVSAEKLSFKEYAEIWKTQYAEEQLTLSVRQGYYAILEHRVYPTLGNLPMLKIKTYHIQGIIDEELKAGRAVTTVKRTLVIINSVMRFAYQQQVIDDNPCLRCSLPRKKAEKKPLQYWTVEQAKAFLDELRTPYESVHKAHMRVLRSSGVEYAVPEYSEVHYTPFQYEVFFTLAIYGGFRRGELCALQWRDINFEDHTVSITRAFASTDNGQILKEPKTAAGIRKVALPRSCFNLLAQLKRQQQEYALKMNSAWEGKRGSAYDENFVFIQMDNGRAMCLQTPYHKFKQVIKQHNDKCEREEDKLPEITMHELRHTSATILIAEGVNVETIAARLGHEDTRTTLNIYGHAIESKDREAADKLEALFDGVN